MDGRPQEGTRRPQIYTARKLVPEGIKTAHKEKQCVKFPSEVEKQLEFSGPTTVRDELFNDQGFLNFLYQTT